MFPKGFIGILSITTIGGLFGFPLSGLATMSSTNYEMWGDVIGVGGSETSQSALYQLQDTVGEAFAESATSTSASYGIKAGLRELQFLTVSIGASSVDLGALTTATTGSGSHTLSVATSAFNGVTVVVSGSTLTSGSDTIDAIGGTAAASAAGSEQFGINVVDNTSPNIGATRSPSGSNLAPAGAYATADQFAFSSGDTIASSSDPIPDTVLTVSYVANISSSTVSGTYTTTITYSVAPNY